jgi:glycosyltransferase involved in cell wall biosynthesis
VENEKRDHRILFVGTHLRDFDVLRRVIQRIEKLSRNLIFTIVTFREHWKMFQGLKKIELVDNVTEEQLLRYYQSHALLFLPLIDGTANNTLLEGAACGIPIVTSDVGAVRDYLDDKSAIILRSGKTEVIVSTIIDLLNDRNKRGELSANARKKILSFDWEHIAERMKRAYEAY